jgi:hemin uptake protein HemP
MNDYLSPQKRHGEEQQEKEVQPKVAETDTKQIVEMDSKSGTSSHSLPKIIKFETLVRCGDEVWIEHAGQIYRLRRTRNEKLILTK